MNVLIERDVLAELSTAVASYLSALTVTADCLEQTCPDVGGPYRQRLLRLRSRLSFDVNVEAIKASTETLIAELKDYASVVERVRTQRRVEVDRGMLALRDMIETLAQRQEFHGEGLRQFAAQLEQTPHAADARAHSEAGALHASSLRNLAESMDREAASTITRMREEITELDGRLAGAASTDPATGLINRAELDRQVEAHRLHGATFTILRFGLQGPLSNQVMRQAAARLSTHFRHCDRVARWSEKEFAVLFVGPDELVNTRAEQAAASLAGRYTLENGEVVEVAAVARIVRELTKV